MPKTVKERLANIEEEEATLKKQVKNKEKSQTQVDSLRASNAAKKVKETQPLDSLEEQESELRRQNEEDQTITIDENTSPSDIEAAGLQWQKETRNWRICKLRTTYAERERALPLSERVKEIFQKYGVTLNT